MKRIANWTLRESLGKGGNAHVWLAEGSGGDLVALKILIRVKGDGYLRFRQEVSFLEGLGPRPGVLPLLAHSLPERPTQTDPAWFAMPVANSLQEWLGEDPPLHEVVSAMQGIANTLADLAKEGIAHRDLKPPNLYWFEGRSCIGDFGLAHFPEKVALTLPRRKLGPLYFLAPEMLSDAATASPFPADVYSLAKSLWVMATGQRYPPPGEQRRDTPGVLLSTYVEDPRAHLLDALIEDSTRHTPDLRPDMESLSADLSAWLEPEPAAHAPENLSDLGKRVTSILDRDRYRQEEKNRPRALAHQLNERFFERTANVGEALNEAGFPVSTVGTTALWDILGKGRLTHHGALVQFGAFMYRVDPGPGRPQLLSGVGVELYEDRHLHLAAAHIVIPFGSVTGAKVPWVDFREAPLVRHAQQEQAIATLANGLLGMLRLATSEFVALFEESKALNG